MEDEVEMTDSQEDMAARELELVFELAGPVGANLQEISRTLADALKTSEGVEVEEIGVSTLIGEIAKKRALTRNDGSERDSPGSSPVSLPITA